MNAFDLNETTNSSESLNESVLWGIINAHFSSSNDNYESISLPLVGLYLPVFFLGILGNGFLLVLIFTKRQLRNVTNLFICSLAVADLAGKSSI